MKALSNFLTILSIVLSLALAGCNTQDIPAEIRTQYTAVIPPNSLYQCPARPVVPNPATLTDGQVAEYLVKLDNGYKICSRSLKAIKAFANGAKLTVESNQPVGR